MTTPIQPPDQLLPQSTCPGNDLIYRPLTGKLPKLTPESACTLQQFFQQVRVIPVTQGDGDTFWRFEFQQQDQSTDFNIELVGSCGTLYIKLTEYRWPRPQLALPWWEYQNPESKQLAWTLVHESLITQLNYLFQDNFVVNAVLTDSDSHLVHSNQQNQWLQWKAIQDQVTAAGLLAISDSQILHLLQGNHWPKRISGYQPTLLYHIDLIAQIFINTEPFSIAELTEFNPGDLFYLGPHNQVRQQFSVELNNPCITPHNLASPSRYIWKAHCNIQDGHHFVKVLAMQQGSKQTPNEQQTDNTSFDPQNLPVNIQFKLKELELPLAEVADVQPGYVFNLQIDIENAMVDIVANQKVIGKGQIIAIEDQLGIQIIELNNHGIE